MRGNNIAGQCGENFTIVTEFVKFNSSIPVVQVWCTSICSCLATDEEFILMGEIAAETLRRQSLPRTFDDQELACGPWHCFVYRNTMKLQTKCQALFETNLKLQCFSPSLSDVICNFIS